MEIYANRGSYIRQTFANPQVSEFGSLFIYQWNTFPCMFTVPDIRVIPMIRHHNQYPRTGINLPSPASACPKTVNDLSDLFFMASRVSRIHSSVGTHEIFVPMSLATISTTLLIKVTGTPALVKIVGACTFLSTP